MHRATARERGKPKVFRAVQREDRQTCRRTTRGLARSGGGLTGCIGRQPASEENRRFFEQCSAKTGRRAEGRRVGLPAAAEG